MASVLTFSAGRPLQQTDFDFAEGSAATFKRGISIDDTNDGVVALQKKVTSTDESGDAEVIKILSSGDVVIFKVTALGKGEFADDLRVKGDLQVDGTQTYVGGTTFQGDTTFGDAASDVVTFFAGVQGDSSEGYDIHPSRSDVSLGQSDDKFESGYFSSLVMGSTFESTVTTGTAPMVVASTTVVANFNADLLDGQEGSYYTNAGNINAGTLSDSRLSSNVFLLDASQTVSGDPTFTGSPTFNDIIGNDQDGTPVADRVFRVIDGLWRATTTGLVEGAYISGASIEAGVVDADTVDTLHASQFLRSDAADSYTGVITSTTGTLDLSGATYYDGLYIPVNSGAPVTAPTYGAGALMMDTSASGLYRYNGSAWIQVWDSQNDGSGSGLDADTLDGEHASAFADASHVHSAADITSGTLAETVGGTGQSTYTTGDILYSDASNSLAKLGIGSAGYVLTVVGGVPAWAAGAAGSFSGLSDTNIVTPSSGQVAIYDGTDSWDNKSISGDATLAASGALTVSTIGGVTPLLTSTSFSGDVTGTYDATVVGDDSHAHTNTTITLASTDLTDTGTLLRTSTTFAGEVDGVYNNLVVDRTITPTWTGKHIWQITGVTPGVVVDLWEGGTATALQNYESSRLRWTASVWNGLAATEKSISAYIAAGPAGSEEYFWRLYDSASGINLIEIAGSTGSATITGDFISSGGGASLSGDLSMNNTITFTGAVTPAGDYNKYRGSVGPIRTFVVDATSGGVSTGYLGYFTGAETVEQSPDQSSMADLATVVFLGDASASESVECAILAQGCLVDLEVESGATGAYVVAGERLIVNPSTGKATSRDKTITGAYQRCLLIIDPSGWTSGVGGTVYGVTLDNLETVV